MRRGILCPMFLAMTSLAWAGVSGAIEDEYVSMLKGKSVIPKIDIKILRVKKDVSASAGRQFSGVQNVEQMKEATEITPQGVRYREEGGGRQVLYSPKGNPLTIEKVSFGRSTVELKVQGKGAPEPTIITFVFDNKLDKEFTDRPVFDKMLTDNFQTVTTTVAP